MDTKFITKFYIKDYLKSALRSAKKGHIHAASHQLTELNGMLSYMYAIRAISKETNKKIRHLITLIRRKYHAY